MALELLPQPFLRQGDLGEHDEPRRVAVDPVDDQRPPLSAWTEMVFDQVVHRRRVAAPLEGDDEQPGRFVQHEQRIIFINDLESARSGGAASGAAGAIHPGTHDVTDAEERRPGRGGGFRAVEKDLPAVERRKHSRSRSEAIAGGQKLVEPYPRILRAGSPLQV